MAKYAAVLMAAQPGDPGDALDRLTIARDLVMLEATTIYEAIGKAVAISYERWPMSAGWQPWPPRLMPADAPVVEPKPPPPPTAVIIVDPPVAAPSV